MPAAARVGDHHTCPKSEPGPVPHVGGAILPAGCPSVLIHDAPAARVGDRSTCVGPPDTIVMGEPSVLIGNQPAARVGDPTSHGGVIVAGCGCVDDEAETCGSARGGEWCECPRCHPAPIDGGRL